MRCPAKKSALSRDLKLRRLGLVLLEKGIF